MILIKTLQNTHKNLSLVLQSNIDSPLNGYLSNIIDVICSILIFQLELLSAVSFSSEDQKKWIILKNSRSCYLKVLLCYRFYIYFCSIFFNEFRKKYFLIIVIDNFLSVTIICLISSLRILKKTKLVHTSYYEATKMMHFI